MMLGALISMNGFLWRTVLIGSAMLLILQAIFAKPIGAWKAEQVKRYPSFLRAFFAPVLPDSQLTADIALVAAIVGSIVLIGLAFIVQF